MDFAEHLKTLRKQPKMTQSQVQKLSKFCNHAYASWERGAKKPTQENLVKIAQVLSVR